VRAQPVDTILPDLHAALAQAGAAVLVAPPGSGKSTRAAPSLLDRLPTEQSVLLLQPRRAAARLVARRIASERGGEAGGPGGTVGGEVGYRVRFEAVVGPDTRLEVMTEGLLARRLQVDPFLLGEGGWGRPVGAVVLDELHERSLQTDLALALLREVRQARPELWLLAMSATLDPGPVAAFLDAPVLQALGRSYPVEIEHLGPDLAPGDRQLVPRVCAAVQRVLAEEAQGDVLVFLPGRGELERVAGALDEARARGMRSEVEVLPLHGGLSAREQDRALSPGGAGRRVVLATNLAETSVTIPGVRAVIDSGLARQPRLDPATGLETLETVLTSRASADQRAGRAGRTGPGRCLRLWTALQHSRREAAEPPEITRLDLTELALQAWAWSGRAEGLRWLSPPPPAAWARAQALLLDLDAVLPGEGLSALGRRLATLPVHPRLGRMLLAAPLAQAMPAAALAALLTERDPWPRGAAVPVEDRLAALLGGPPRGADPRGLDTARQVTERLARLVGGSTSGAGRSGPRGSSARHSSSTDLGALLPALLAGFPERLGHRRGPGDPRVKLASGRGAELAPGALPLGATWLVALGLEGRPRGEDRISLAVEVPEPAVAALPRHSHRSVAWDEQRSAVVAAVEERVGALVLARTEVLPQPEEAAAALVQVLSRDPARLLQPSPEAAALAHRVAWLRARRPALELPAWPDLDAALRAVLPELCAGRRTLQQVQQADLQGALARHLGRARPELDRLAPAQLRLPTGRPVSLDYSPLACQGGPPVLRARMQQLFGLARTPAVLDGAEPVLLHLLAPNDRPVQVTADLAGFWQRTWAQVRADLRGRYPKHAWPEDPLAATAEDRPRRRQ